MQDYIEKRVLEISSYIMESSATVRQTAAIFGVSKSTCLLYTSPFIALRN